jgi:hypothetical protein
LSVGIPIRNIPQSVLNEVVLGLQQFLVVLFFLRPQNSEPQVRFIGSGTLVEIQGTHHILTAAHVWHKTEGARQIGLVLAASRSRFMMPREAISVKLLWDHKHPEWGPDLALLQLTPSIVPTIAAQKSFLNLTYQRTTLATHPPATEKGLWAVAGLVGELSKVQRHSAERTIIATAPVRALFSAVQETHQHGGYDYLDLSAKLKLSDVPSSFGGLSGGGLWEVGLSMSKSGTISWDERRHLRGVAFWQSRLSDGRRVIRCHGPRSIFKRAWESWGLPRDG